MAQVCVYTYILVVYSSRTHLKDQYRFSVAPYKMSEGLNHGAIFPPRSVLRYWVIRNFGKLERPKTEFFHI